MLGWGSSGGSGAQAGQDGSETRTGPATFVGVAATCAFLGWFVSLALGRMAHGLRDLAAYGLGYGAQAYAYGLLLTDRYPSSDPDDVGPTWSLGPHPVRLVLEDDGRRSRLTVLFRLLLALPHLVWLTLWTIAAFLAAIANGLVALVRGRSAEPLHRFLAAYVRYTAHVDRLPPARREPVPRLHGRAGVSGRHRDRPARARRAAGSRCSAPSSSSRRSSCRARSAGALAVAGFLGWFASLATGRMPTGLRNLGAVAIRYHAQTNAYWFVVTDTLPVREPGAAAAAGAGARGGARRGRGLTRRGALLDRLPRSSSSRPGPPPPTSSGTAACRTGSRGRRSTSSS